MLNLRPLQMPIARQPSQPLPVAPTHRGPCGTQQATLAMRPDTSAVYKAKSAYRTDIALTVPAP